MLGFIRTLLFIIVVYYLVKVVTRYILPLLLNNYVNRKMNDFSNRGNAQQRYDRGKKEGEVTIDSAGTGPSPAKRKDRGEYVDYEEIKD